MATLDERSSSPTRSVTRPIPFYDAVSVGEAEEERLVVYIHAGLTEYLTAA
jgi:hypothetical protein